MSIDSEALLIRDVQEERKRTASYFRIAHRLGITPAKVRAILDENPVTLNKPRTSTYGGRGPEHMQKYIVAIKNAYEDWDLTNGDIVLMRADYELGTHEMCQGRDGDNIIQYSIPRAKPQPHVGYFSTTGVTD